MLLMQLKEEGPYTLCQSPDYFYIRCLTSGPHFSPLRLGSPRQLCQLTYRYLSISRRTNRMVQIDAEQYLTHLEEVSISHIIKFYLVIGTLILNQEPYLLLASDITETAQYVDYPIYNIIDTIAIPYRSKKYQKDEAVKEQQKILETLQKTYLNQFFYFSYTEDIATPLIGPKNKSQFQFNEFVWNRYLLSTFLNADLPSCWTIPIIQGFAAQIKKTSAYYTWTYLNLSKRSTFMAGTRFNSRGMDEEGHSSNFVQTQQIIKCHNCIYVHVSVRGSVPLYWRQQKFRGAIAFGKDNNGHKGDEEEIMRKHYVELQEKYQAQVTTVNLLSKDKSPEKELKNRFEALLTRNIKRPYLFFDLNSVMEESADGQLSLTHFLTKKWQQIFGKHSFSILQAVTLQPLQRQSVLPRVNCLDCLDRTNVMQARISQAFVYQVADHINKQVQCEEKRLKIKEDFIGKLIRLWAVLGDRISLIYCGTGSVAAHMTLKQNNSWLSTLGGAFTSFNRYLNANNSDLFKQKCIDSMLGTRGQQSETQYFNHNVQSELNQSLYCSFQAIDIAVVTFNTSRITVNNASTAGVQSFVSNALHHKEAELVFYALQEVEHGKRWANLLDQAMAKRGYSISVNSFSDKANLLSLVFVKKNSPFLFKFVHLCQLSLRSTNGGLVLFFQTNSSILLFLNCRLQGGYTNRYFRLQDFNQLHNSLLKQTYSNQLLQQSQAIFLAGDFNLRLSNNIDKQFKLKNTVEDIYTAQVGNREDMQLIKQGLAYDQLDTIKKSQFFQYSQEEIRFFPTYCFSSKKSGFDKTKPPAWCDRIFYVEPAYHKRREGACPPIHCTNYNRIEERLWSSHKGVVGQFKMHVKTTNEEKKQMLMLKYNDSKKEQLQEEEVIQ